MSKATMQIVRIPLFIALFTFAQAQANKAALCRTGRTPVRTQIHFDCVKLLPRQKVSKYGSPFAPSII